MPIDLINTAYAFDPTGRLLANKIIGEQQILTSANYRDFHFIVPDFAPFFAQDLVVSFRALNGEVRILNEGVDYQLTHWFISGSRACAKPIYGSISILDLQLSGVITLTYQTVGGIWTQETSKLAEILADRLHNPRITAWDVVVDMPISFPPIDHEWDLVDMVGMSDVVTGLGAIETAIIEKTTATTALAQTIANLTYIPPADESFFMSQ